MLEKMMHKSGNMLQNRAIMGAEIEKILIKMEVQKKYGFLVHRAGHKTLAPESAAAILGGPF